jgi:predicted phage replisome organizer
MADVKWIKLATDIFDNRKIRQIECLPDGDSIIVVWVKLMCLAGNINDSGFVYFTKEIPYTDQMLSAQFNRPLTTVQLALKTFEQFGMIEVIDNVLRISNWEKYQSVDRLAEIREYNRIAKQKSRAKQKLLPDVNDKSMTSQRCHETDIDIEEDKEEDKNKRDIEPTALPPKRKVFQKPSLDDIKAYCKESGYHIDAERFVNYYESNGWMVGRNKMKDWKATVRNWASKDKKTSLAQPDYGDPEDFYK